MSKIDLKKDLKSLYNPSPREISLVEVPPLKFIMVDGSGDPNTAQEYQEAIESLYSLSYSLKFRLKKEKGLDYTVMPLESLWWTDDMSQFSPTNKAIWKWSCMILQPDFITDDIFQSILEQVGKKKPLPGLSKVRFQVIHEGLSAQILYIGPYSEEGPTIEKIHHFVKSQGYAFDGLVHKHHEIYLNDFRRTAPEKLKTVIRQPVGKIG
jgi:hypothetical protein